MNIIKIDTKDINTVDYYCFEEIVNDIISNSTVQELKNFTQHYNTTRYNHCMHVAYYSYMACRKLGLDYISAARGGMLHDLFLYDWRQSCKNKKFKDFHAFAHPRVALENATKIFDLNDIEKDIIIKHMWPITLKLPKYKESLIVTFADKYSAMLESFNHYFNILHSKKFYKYAYMFFGLLFFRLI